MSILLLVHIWNNVHICNIAIYADDTTLYSKCNQASDLQQLLQLASELEFDLQDTVNRGKKLLVDFNIGNNHWKITLVPLI